MSKIKDDVHSIREIDPEKEKELLKMVQISIEKNPPRMICLSATPIAKPDYEMTELK